jgi:hypothetical protein
VTASPGLTAGPYTLSAHLAWILTGDGDFYTDGSISGDSLRMNSGYTVSCEQTDRTVNIDLRIGQPEHTAAGVPCWRFDRANGWWELIDLNGGADAAIYFPIEFTGRLMTTYVQAFAAAGAIHSVLAALQITAPAWGTPGTAPTVTNANESTIIFGIGAWGEDFINHSLGLGTVINLGTNNYAIRIRGQRVGDRIRAIKHSIRYSTIGPGGIGG